MFQRMHEIPADYLDVWKDKKERLWIISLKRFRPYRLLSLSVVLYLFFSLLTHLAQYVYVRVSRLKLFAFLLFIYLFTINTRRTHTTLFHFGSQKKLRQPKKLTFISWKPSMPSSMFANFLLKLNERQWQTFFFSSR